MRIDRRQLRERRRLRGILGSHALNQEHTLGKRSRRHGTTMPRAPATPVPAVPPAGRAVAAHRCLSAPDLHVNAHPGQKPKPIHEGSGQDRVVIAELNGVAHNGSNPDIPAPGLVHQAGKSRHVVFRPLDPSDGKPERAPVAENRLTRGIGQTRGNAFNPTCPVRPIRGSRGPIVKSTPQDTRTFPITREPPENPYAWQGPPDSAILGQPGAWVIGSQPSPVHSLQGPTETTQQMEVLRGIAVSPGLVIGRVFLFEDEGRRVVRRFTPAAGSADESERAQAALQTSIADLQAVKERAEREMGAEAAKIFLFHIGVLQDKSLRDPIFKRIEQDHMAAEHAVDETFGDWAKRFASMGDSAFTTKVNDLEDLRNRVLGHLMGEHNRTLDDLKHQAIVLADDLTPSQAAGFNRELVLAFVTDRGGRTSHTAIVARALNIPAVVGVRGVAKAAEEDQTVIVDGLEGVVIIDPTDEQLDRYKERKARMERRQTMWKEQASEPSVTTDGVPIRLLGNIEFPDEISHVIEVGGQGVGLYRTEFLYLASDHEPSEEEHYQAYKRCVEQLNGMELVVRTVDLGADKYTQHRVELPERNPFLGNRSIRYCLSNLPMFKRQLRAILRASAHGPLKIMFPLVTTVQELRQAKAIVRDVMEDLADEDIQFDRNVPMGMMIEVPAAAVIASSFARDAAFFSIGTNDLVQYTLAVDRTNERVADLFTAMHPAVLRLVRDTMRGAKSRQIPVSCCGESAAELDFAVLLIGLGVRTLSVGSYSIPQVKKLVRSVSAEECARIARRALSLESPSDVAAYVRERVRKVMPGVFDSAED